MISELSKKMYFFFCLLLDIVKAIFLLDESEGEYLEYLEHIVIGGHDQIIIFFFWLNIENVRSS